jgi:hypothetical protein
MFCCQLLVVTACFVLAGCDGSSTPVSHPRITTFSGDIQEVVAPLRGIITDSQDIALAAQFHDEFADVIERDKDVITSTGVIRTGYIRAETLMLQRTEMVGKYPGFGVVKDDVLKQVLGLASVQLTDAKRADAVEAFRAIAGAIRNIRNE